MNIIDIVLAVAGLLFGGLCAIAVLLPKLRREQARATALDDQLALSSTTLVDTKAQLAASLQERARIASIEKDLAGESARREGLEKQNASLTTDLDTSRGNALTAERSLASAQSTIQSLNEALDKVTNRVGDLERDVESMRTVRDDALLNAANAKKDVEHATALHQQTKQFLEDAAKQLTTQFQAVSAQVLDQRGKILGEQHVERLGAIVQPLSQHIKVLEDKLALAETSRAEDRGSVVTMIKDLASAQTMLQTEASQLSKALRGNVKARGSWGESLLDKVLESSGLVEGRNYRKQISSRDDDEGKTLRPDVVVDLPDDRSIVVDSKVSLIAYDRYVNAENEHAAAEALVDHVQAIRARIKELSDKNYSKSFGAGGLDFVLMFVPIEGALALAVQERPELQTEALNKKVALVSPMTLHIALRTVEYLWRMDTLSRSMEQIVDKGRLVHDEAVRLGESLIDLDKRLSGSRDAFDAIRTRLLDPSRGIIRRAQELHKLGVAGKSKKTMPEQLALAVDGGDQLDVASPLEVAIDGIAVGDTDAASVAQ